MKFKQRVKHEFAQMPITWEAVLADAIERQQQAQARVRQLTGVIRDAKRRIKRGEQGPLVQEGK
jgi:hypothetical protein